MEATTAACDTASAGKIRWSGSDFEGCNGTSWVTFTYSPVVIPTVTSATGKVWMDRNLGASQVATSFDDTAAYGDLYQWGRPTDGHEQRDSGTVGTQWGGAQPQPDHGDFITGFLDWLSTPDPALWNGVAGINNPCPTSFRLPTDTEWQDEIDQYGATGIALFDSPLKLVAAGDRGYSGTLNYAGSYGFYWSSTVGGASARRLSFNSGFAVLGSLDRARGFSVRCLKD